MRVLLISNQCQNAQGVGNPIMYRMLKALTYDGRLDDAEFFPFKNSLSSFLEIRKEAKRFDVVHVHFGGLYALFIWFAIIGMKCRKFITFHGTDIHAKAIRTAKSKAQKIKIKLNQYASFISIGLYDRCGFVAEEMMEYVPKCLKRQLKRKAFVHLLGVDYDAFRIIEKEVAKEYLELDEHMYILFSDVSNTSIKRRDIAEQIVSELGTDYRLLIMCGVKPDIVPYYVNACEFLLLTSDEEGSPNIIRECLALNKPVFSVDVGDATKQLDGLCNSKIISRIPKIAAETIISTLGNEYTDNSREKRRAILDFNELTREVVDIYMKKST